MKLEHIHTDPDCPCFVCDLARVALLSVDGAVVLMKAQRRGTPPEGADLVDAYRAAILQVALIAVLAPYRGEKTAPDARVEQAVEWLRDNADRVRLRRRTGEAMREARTATKQ